jgi:hypothetical protein
MNLARLEQDINSLPSEVQMEVIDYIAFLKHKYGKKKAGKVKQEVVGQTADQLLKSEVVGLWKRRKITDSAIYARELREKAQQRSRS